MADWTDIKEHRSSKPSDPVHQDAADGKWYFWDETWADRCGPFDTKEACRIALYHYAVSLDRETEESLR